MNVRNSGLGTSYLEQELQNRKMAALRARKKRIFSDATHQSLQDHMKMYDAHRRQVRQQAKRQAAERRQDWKRHEKESKDQFHYHPYGSVQPRTPNEPNPFFLPALDKRSPADHGGTIEFKTLHSQNSHKLFSPQQPTRRASPRHETHNSDPLAHTPRRESEDLEVSSSASEPNPDWETSPLHKKSPQPPVNRQRTPPSPHSPKQAVTPSAPSNPQASANSHSNGHLAHEDDHLDHFFADIQAKIMKSVRQKGMTERTHPAD